MGKVTMFRLQHIILFSLALLVSGCANFPMSMQLDPPQVAVENISLAKSTALSPRFLVSLRITNPNPISLPVTGMSYSIALNSFDLIRGVSNQVPSIPAYGEVPIELEVGTDVIGLARFLASLAGKSMDSLTYDLNAKIDLQGMLPSMNITESGLVPLQR